MEAFKCREKNAQQVESRTEKLHRFQFDVILHLLSFSFKKGKPYKSLHFTHNSKKSILN